MTKRALITPRLRLEPPTEAHLDALIDIHRRNAERFATRMARLIQSKRDAKRLLAESPRAERYVIVRTRPRTVIGMVSLNNIELWPFLNASIGYSMDHLASGEGYAREAVGRVVQHAFSTRGLHRVEANIMPDNAPSIRLVKALGFRLEGKSPRMLFLDGEWRDQLRFALTREEWTP